MNSIATGKRFTTNLPRLQSKSKSSAKWVMSLNSLIKAGTMATLVRESLGKALNSLGHKNDRKRPSAKVAETKEATDRAGRISHEPTNRRKKATCHSGSRTKATKPNTEQSRPCHQMFSRNARSTSKNKKH